MLIRGADPNRGESHDPLFESQSLRHIFPIYKAVLMHCPTTKEHKPNIPACQLLLDFGADVTKRNCYGFHLDFSYDGILNIDLKSLRLALDNVNSQCGQCISQAYKQITHLKVYENVEEAVLSDLVNMSDQRVPEEMWPYRLRDNLKLIHQKRANLIRDPTNLILQISANPTNLIRDAKKRLLPELPVNSRELDNEFEMKKNFDAVHKLHRLIAMHKQGQLIWFNKVRLIFK